MKSLAITGLLICFCFSEVIAQQPLADTINIKGVEVKTRKIHQKEKSAYPIQSLTAKGIESVAGTSVAEAVKTFSGVTLRDYGGIGGLKTIMVRSLGANHTGVFIDGVAVTDIASGQVDLSKLPLEGLEEVSLELGNASQQCITARAQASASLINLRSKNPDFGNRKTNGNLSLKAGMYGLINPTLSLNQKTGKKSWIGLNLNYLQAEGNYPYLVDNGPAGTHHETRGNSDITALSANAVYNFSPSDSSGLQARLRIYESERGLPGAVIFYNPHSSQRLTNKDMSVNLQYRSDKKKISTQSNAGWSRAWLRYVDPDYLGYTSSLDNKYLQHEYYLSQAMSIKAGKQFTVSAATDLILNSFSSNLYNNSNPMRYSLLISGGVSHQTRTTETSAGLLLSLVGDIKDGDEKMKDFSKISPWANFTLRIFDDPAIRLRLMYKQIFRLPSFNDLYYNLVGNPGLKPENAGQINAGLLFSKNLMGTTEVNLRIDAFSNRVSNKIIAVPTQNLFVWSMRNIGKVNTQGIELQIETESKISADMSIGINMNYTYQQALDMTDQNSASYKHQIPYIPYETFSGMYLINYRSFAVNYNLLFNGFRYSASENVHENLLPGWWISDTGLSWKIETSRINYKIKAEVSNLFNREYVVIRSFPMPGRSFALTATLQF
jgi:outer membrane cobalamin receptor